MTIKYLTTTEAAEVLGISRGAVQQLINRERLPAVRFGRDWMIDPKSLVGFKFQHRGRPKNNSEKSTKTT